MNPRWLRPGDALAGAAGALLLVSLFLPWYAVRGGRGHVTGWQAFTIVDLVLALVAAVGLALTLAVMTRRSPVLPIALGSVGTLAGALGAVVALVRILDAPGPSGLLGVAAGAWLGLAGALGVAAGAWWSLSDERNRGVPPVSAELRPAP